MTAVDHAEMKRLADELRVSWSDRGWVASKKIQGLLDEARRAADGLDALLSEIEGLKASASVIEPELGDLEASNKDLSRLLSEAERELADLRTQAQDSWRPDRAVQDIVAERQRQQSAEGWSTGHDDEHDGGELAKAAACYAAGKIVSAIPTEIDPDRGAAGYRSVWPWDMTWWKPKTYRHNLIRAAALLVAEIERLDRRAALRPQTAESGK